MKRYSGFILLGRFHSQPDKANSSPATAHLNSKFKPTILTFQKLWDQLLPCVNSNISLTPINSTHSPPQDQPSNIFLTNSDLPPGSFYPQTPSHWLCILQSPTGEPPPLAPPPIRLASSPTSPIIIATTKLSRRHHSQGLPSSHHRRHPLRPPP